MRIQPSTGIIYSDTDAKRGSYWWQGAALVGSVLPERDAYVSPYRVLMIGSCGWGIAAAYDRLGGPLVDWYGYEPNDGWRVAGHNVAIREGLVRVKGAWKTPELVAEAQPLPFECVIVDAYEGAKAVAEWQSPVNVRSAFRLAGDCPIVIHGEVGAYSDKWRVVRS